MSTERRVPLPHKLRGLFAPMRHKVLHGGRGGGKSWSVATALLLLAVQKPLRILCAREVQRSIAQSVHQLLVDSMVRLGLESFFEVTEREIRGKNGSQFLFSGLLSHTVASIKSFEGADIVWIEEGQSVSKKSLDILLPTIRKAGSEIWITMNPDMSSGAVYERFLSNELPDVWAQQINWRDNPWFSPELDAERRHCEEFDPDNYQNIWEGVARQAAAGAIYAREVENLYADGRVCVVPHDPDLPVHTVWDLGWNDSTAIGFVQRTSSEARIIDYIEDSHRTLEWYVSELGRRPWKWGTDFLPHDGRTRNFQTGLSPQQNLWKLGRKDVRVLPVGMVEQGILFARSFFSRCFFDEQKTARLLECLRRYRREVNARTGQAEKPAHDEYSHGADMFRYMAQAAELMRNESPDYEEAPRPVYV